MKVREVKKLREKLGNMRIRYRDEFRTNIQADLN